jgi:hypothetical protein
MEHSALEQSRQGALDVQRVLPARAFSEQRTVVFTSATRALASSWGGLSPKEQDALSLGGIRRPFPRFLRCLLGNDRSGVRSGSVSCPESERGFQVRSGGGGIRYDCRNQSKVAIRRGLEGSFPTVLRPNSRGFRPVSYCEARHSPLVFPGLIAAFPVVPTPGGGRKFVRKYMWLPVPGAALAHTKSGHSNPLEMGIRTPWKWAFEPPEKEVKSGETERVFPNACK